MYMIYWFENKQRNNKYRELQKRDRVRKLIITKNDKPTAVFVLTV